ncbi:hypothetical protein ACFR99_18085 [Haloarchaeobius amylolyticus]|uniref:Uncharacterized protein n=1 Tax=Haloarchaeobius amylolyticus TaxID=1198296 RepID=A0ABD6BKV2_9EURY
MNRRQYLARTGAAGVSTGLIASLAGCLDGLPGSSEGSDVEVSDRTGQRALDRAAGRLNKAAQSLNDLEGLENPEEVEFDPTEPRAHLDAAREHLETAETELGDDRAADVETLRSYADALDGLLSVTVTVTDETIADDIDAVNAALEEEGDLEKANGIVDARYTKISDASHRHTQVDATITEIDDERLADLAGIELADLEDGAATLGDVVTSLETLAGAYDMTIDDDEGYGALEHGQSHVDDGEYEAAQDEFETAETTFATSLSQLEDGRAEAPEGLADYFETAICQNRHLTEAAAAFADGAAAAADGDPAARTYQSKGETELEAVRNCTD